MQFSDYTGLIHMCPFLTVVQVRKILFRGWKVAALRNSITACQRREENPGCSDLPCLSCLAWMIVRWPWRERKTTLFEAKKKKKTNNVEYSPQLAGLKILLTLCQFYLFIASEGWSTLFLRHEGSGGGGRGREKWEQRGTCRRWNLKRNSGTVHYADCFWRISQDLTKISPNQYISCL